MADREPIELTEEERLAAGRDNILLEAARRLNGPDAPSIAELFPDVIPVSDLDAAAACGQVYRVKLALNDGADVDESGPFGTPLHGAAENGHLEVVRLLVEHGADVRLLNPAGETARLRRPGRGTTPSPNTSAASRLPTPDLAAAPSPPPSVISAAGVR